LRDVLASVITYEKSLEGFERVSLQSGETKEVVFTLNRKNLQLFNKHNEWVVEPGDFKVMIGASSTDIRLNRKFTVIDYDSSKSKIRRTTKQSETGVAASTEQEKAKLTEDNNLTTYWIGNKGDYITYSLENDSKIDELFIAWQSDTSDNVYFEIQLSGGGGQFLTVYSGKANEFNRLISYPFKETAASDLRIVLNTDRVGIAEVKMKGRKK
jgi:beta-glucosidase